MAKNETINYRCSNCLNETVKWYGKCPNCSEYGTLEEFTKASAIPEMSGLKTASAVTPTEQALTLKELSTVSVERYATGINEFDRVLGGGFVESEVVLFGGHPGAGKSTLALSISESFAKSGLTVLYSSGEESGNQIAIRAKRMGISSDNIKVINETNLEKLLGQIDAIKPNFLIVDSLQTIASASVPASVGNVAQSKEAAHVLTRLAKKNNIMMLLINQINKDGEFSGSEAIQHIVDCSIMLESDSGSFLKFLRSSKNRFGSTTEIGVFQHSDKGLEEVLDPSEIFLENNDPSTMGTSLSFVNEGVRVIAVEIQALANKSFLPTPRKQFSGVSYHRGQIVCAILDKFCKAKLYEKDVFLSTISGIKVDDPQCDLSIAASLLSSAFNKNFKEKTLFIGELSLTGRVRGNYLVVNKVKEALKMGVEKIVAPTSSKKSIPKDMLNKGDIQFISSVVELNKFLMKKGDE